MMEFKEKLWFVFDEAKSLESLNHRVTVVNTPLLMIIGFIDSKVKEYYLSMFSPLVSNIIYVIFRFFDEMIIEERTVGEILTGRSLGILKLVDSLSSPLRSIGIPIPLIGVGIYKLTTSFGFIQLRDNQTFGPAEVFTGQTDIGKFNTFYSMNGEL